MYVIYGHFCTKYELICSFNTFCTCISPYYVQKTYKTTYEFHFQLVFSRRVRSVTSHGVPSHLAGRGSIHYIYFGRSPSRRPRFVRINCHFCTKYELICSFNTFCMCIRPYYVQKTYKTTYEFHFQLVFSRRVGSVGRGGRDFTRSFPAARRTGEHSLYISGVLRVGDPVLYVYTVISVLNTN